MTGDALRTQLADKIMRTSWQWVRSELYLEQAETVVHEAWPLIADALARARAEGAAEALQDAAKDWRWSAWSDVPRVADRVAERIGTANYVGDWLAQRASALSAHTTEGDPT